jgi:hypothetical protein
VGRVEEDRDQPKELSRLDSDRILGVTYSGKEFPPVGSRATESSLRLQRLLSEEIVPVPPVGRVASEIGRGRRKAAVHRVLDNPDGVCRCDLCSIWSQSKHTSCSRTPPSDDQLHSLSSSSKACDAYGRSRASRPRRTPSPCEPPRVSDVAPIVTLDASLAPKLVEHKWTYRGLPGDRPGLQPTPDHWRMWPRRIRSGVIRASTLRSRIHRSFSAPFRLSLRLPPATRKRRSRQATC